MSVSRKAGKHALPHNLRQREGWKKSQHAMSQYSNASAQVEQARGTPYGTSFRKALANAFGAESSTSHLETRIRDPLPDHKTVALETKSSDPSAVHSMKKVEAENRPLERCSCIILNSGMSVRRAIGPACGGGWPVACP